MADPSEPPERPTPPSLVDVAHLAGWAEEIPAWLDQVAASAVPFPWFRDLTAAEVATMDDARDALAAWACGHRVGGDEALAMAAAAEERLAELQPALVAAYRGRLERDPHGDPLAAMRSAAWTVTVELASSSSSSSALGEAWLVAHHAAALGGEDAIRASVALQRAMAERDPELPARVRAAAGLAPGWRVPEPFQLADLGEGRLLQWREVADERDLIVGARAGPYELRIEMAPFADDEFHWTIRPIPTAAAQAGPPALASGWERSMTDAASAAEGTLVELASPRVTTPAEAEAYLAAHPGFAARVEAHGRELAAQLGLVVAELRRSPGAAPGDALAPAPGEAAAAGAGAGSAHEHGGPAAPYVASTRAEMGQALYVEGRTPASAVPAAAELRGLVVRSGDDAATVASRIGVEPEWVRGVLTGEISEVDPGGARLLSDAIGCPVGEVFGTLQTGTDASDALLAADPGGPELDP